MNPSADHTALIVIDVQQGLFEPPPDDADAVLARIDALVRRARAAGVPVWWVQHEEAGALEAGTPAWQVHAALAPAAEDPRVRKRVPSAFDDTGLAAALDARGIGHLVVCGYASDCCVDATTRAASQRGYAVTLAADAHTTHDQPGLPASRIRMEQTRVLCALAGGGPVRATPAADLSFGR